MEKEVIENKLRCIPHKFFFVNGKSFKTIHNNKENAITIFVSRKPTDFSGGSMSIA